jgi:flagellar M-ring protein FliF
MIAAVAASIFLLKGLMKRLKTEKIIIGTYNNSELAVDSFAPPELPRPAAAPQIGAKAKKPMLPLGDIEDDISDEAIRKKNQQEKISHYVSKNPVEAAKLINAWLHEDEF